MRTTTAALSETDSARGIFVYGVKAMGLWRSW